MFKLGDRVVVTTQYGPTDNEDIVGCAGTVTQIFAYSVWPFQVNLDLNDRTASKEYRTSLFTEEELTFEK